jgi:SH3 domain-containing YSC84-like protein 1
MKKVFSAFLAIALSALPLASLAASKETDRLENCGTVLDEILRIPDNVPQDLLDKAECVIVIPSVLKAAFVFGGDYGRGAMTCRSAARPPIS